MAIASTSAAIAASSAAIAANAARRAEDARCHTYIDEFNSQTATQAEQIAYARCVERFAPVEDYTAAKIVVAILLVAIVIGVVFGWTAEHYDRGMNAVMGGICGLLVAMVGMLLLGALYFVVAA